MGVQNEWLVTGDFNLIARANEKSSDNINIHMMGRFHSVTEDLELLEFHLMLGDSHGSVIAETTLPPSLIVC